MLAAKRSAGVAPEVNLRNSLHAGNKAHKQGGSTLALKPRGDRSPKQGYQWSHKKGSCPPKIFLKKLIHTSIKDFLFIRHGTSYISMLCSCKLFACSTYNTPLKLYYFCLLFAHFFHSLNWCKTNTNNSPI